MKKITMFFLFLLSAWFTYGQEVTIGAGTLTDRFPFGALWGYERSAALYTATEIGQTGFINQLAWDLSNAAAARSVKIYLKETESTSVTAANWTTFTTGATLVYDGTIEPTTAGFYSFVFTSSFPYTGGTKNLLVLVESNFGGNGGGDSYNVKGTRTPGMHFIATSDGTPPTGNLSENSGSNRPNLKITFGDEITCPGIRPMNVSASSTEVTFEVSIAGDFFYEIRTTGEAGSGETGLVTSGTVEDDDTVPVTVSTLLPNTRYNLYVHPICEDDDNPVFSSAFAFTTALIANTLPYMESFEGETNFAYIHDTTNKWYIGNAVNNGGTKSLYVSNNEGVANQYSNGTSQVSHAYSDFIIPENINEISLRFDWRCVGETTAWDRFRVWAVPVSYIPTAGTQISAGNGRVQLGRENYNGNNAFLAERLIVNATAFAGQTMRLVFEWRNDGGGGENPPGAIDNLTIEAITCSQPGNLTLESVTADSATIDWGAINSATSYDVYISTNPGEPTGTPTVVNVTATTHTFEDLDPNTHYYVWVRSICSDTEASLWTGPLNVVTSLIAVDLPYQDNFETDHEYGIINHSVNKWYIGNAVNNGGTRAMYISNDEGVTNAYLNSQQQVSHIYKDFNIDTDAVDVEITFDWRCVGETTSWDRFRVWVVPLTYLPTADTQITAGDGRVQLGRENYNGNTVFLSERLVTNVTAFAGQTMRLVFEWRNDGGGGNNPPAAIDNLNIKQITCPTVNVNTITVGSITRNSATVSWTAVTGINTYDVYLSTSGQRPTDETVPTATVTATTYTRNDLSDGTQYYVWVRSHCSDTDTGYWEGPIVFATKLIPVNLPYFEDFDENPKFGYINDTKNKWFTGQADNIDGEAMYISKDGGISNSYDVNGAQVSHIYKDLIFPAQAGNYTMSFNWRGVGESTWDFLKIWLVPSTYEPVAGTQTTVENSGGVQLGEALYNENGVFKNERISIDGSEYADQTMRLIFEWKQDTGGGTQPPAAIKNLYIKPDTCLEVEDIIVEKIEDTNDFHISWTPGGQETKWELVVVELGQEDPIYNTPGILVEGAPEYTFEDAVEEVFYRVYVRPICSDTDKGFWTGPEEFSIFYPPGCASIAVEDLDLEISEDGNYYLCQDEPITLNLNATYYDIKSTSEYVIESIDYDPPFPFKGGTGSVEINTDDRWSGIIDLGFDFCFFGNNFNKVLITDNGAITFSIRDVVDEGRYQPNSPSGFSLNENNPLPYNPGPTSTQPPYVNAIFGVLQDLDPRPGSSPADKSINYQIIGSYPCRALVFNVYHLGLWTDLFDPDDIEGSTQTTQVVLYEGTNIIEVYVKNRPAAQDHNNGNGVLGIQNEDATIAYVPEGRNIGRWTTQNEAWRFVPSGPSISTFQWLRDGEFYSNDTDISVTIEQSTVFTGEISYTHCNGEQLKIKKNFNFLKEPFELSAPSTLYDCAKKPGSEYLYNLDDNIEKVMQGLDVSEFTIEYFTNKADFDAGINQVGSAFTTTDPNGTKIYMKVTNKLTRCPKDVSFNLSVREQLGATQVNNIFICKEIVLPKLAEGEAYYTGEYGQGIRYNAGDLYNVVGKNTLYVYHEDENKCYGQFSFTIEILPEVFSPVFEDHVFSCQAYTLPELPEGSKYYTQPNEGGIELFAEYEVIVPMTIYIVTRNGNKDVFCYDESSFTVSFEECPIPKGISPNADGVNDSFDLSNHGVSKLQIFNRNGVEVYSYGLGYKNQWMGQNNSNKLLPSGTYYYVVVSHGNVRTGWVQLNY